MQECNSQSAAPQQQQQKGITIGALPQQDRKNYENSRETQTNGYSTEKVGLATPKEVQIESPVCRVLWGGQDDDSDDDDGISSLVHCGVHCSVLFRTSARSLLRLIITLLLLLPLLLRRNQEPRVCALLSLLSSHHYYNSSSYKEQPSANRTAPQ